MSDQIFSWCVDLDSYSDSQKFTTISTKYGDGYEQNTSVGINNRAGEWSVSKTAVSAEIQQIKLFLDTHKGADSFLWDVPLGSQVRVKASEYSLSKLGGDVWKITTTFTQVFYP